MCAPKCAVDIVHIYGMHELLLSTTATRCNGTHANKLFASVKLHTLHLVCSEQKPLHCESIRLVKSYFKSPLNKHTHSDLLRQKKTLQTRNKIKLKLRLFFLITTTTFFRLLSDFIHSLELFHFSEENQTKEEGEKVTKFLEKTM